MQWWQVWIRSTDFAGFADSWLHNFVNSEDKWYQKLLIWTHFNELIEPFPIGWFVIILIFYRNIEDSLMQIYNNMFLVPRKFAQAI